MSKLSISDLHHANDISFVESVKLQDGDVLKAAAERAIAAREIAGGTSSFKPICPPPDEHKPIGIKPCPPLIVGLIAPSPSHDVM